ncbi:LytR/AlgR family response regulator transcription factor [Novilysobacter ciconiae]|uniref:LytR/AlgR family response regulator transcription factor n=1 Tax=Novilysobacter ciconiae TaxID=2781022 RepID=UPI001D16DE48|nr:response regulator [Lysobacter ciconiae]
MQVVEDEPLIRERLLRMCGELAGGRARFDAVADLDLAGDRLQRSLYDGLLLDLNLGGEDGFDLLRQAVAGRYHCVVVSAHRERALQAFEHGVLDFVPKPFTRERLGQTLNRLLDAARYRPGLARYLGIWRARHWSSWPTCSGSVQTVTTARCACSMAAANCATSPWPR